MGREEEMVSEHSRGAGVRKGYKENERVVLTGLVSCVILSL